MFLNKAKIGSSLRWMLAAVACLYAGWALAPSGATFSGAQAQASGVTSGIQNALDSSTSHTLVLNSLEKKAKKGQLTFSLLRETKLNRKPPPIFTDELAALDNQKVTMYGFMAPYDSLVDMRLCMIMPTSQGCQFCSPPSHVEVVFVRQAAEEKQPYIDGPVFIEGRLSLWKEGSDNEMHRQFLFVIEDAKVTPVSKMK